MDTNRPGEQFLGYLAQERNVSASTQNQAFGALMFLYEKVLEIKLPTIDALRAKRAKRLPVVLSAMEVKQLLAGLTEIETREPYGLMCRLMHGTGMRVKMWIASESRSSCVKGRGQGSGRAVSGEPAR